MTSDRKKPTAGFWITVVLVAVLVGYPLSWGPVDSLLWRGYADGSIPEWLLGCMADYLLPMQWALDNSPERISGLIRWYMQLWF